MFAKLHYWFDQSPVHRRTFSERSFLQIVQTTPSFVALNLVMAGLLLFSDGLVAAKTSWLGLYGVILVALANLARLGLWVHFQHRLLKEDQPPIPVNGMSALVLNAAVGQAALTISYFTYYGPADANSLLGLVILCGLAASGASTFAVSSLLANAFLATILVVPGVSLILFGGKAVTIGVLVILLGGFLSRHVHLYRKRITDAFVERDTAARDRALLRRVIDSMPALVSLIDRNRNYVILNQPLLDALAASEELVVGKPAGFMRGDDNFVTVLNEFAESGLIEFKPRRIPIYTPQGLRWHLLHMRWIPPSGGYICVSVDVHEAVLLERQNEENKTRLVQSAKMASLGEMAGGISHEINNPLSIIVGRADILQTRLSQSTPNLELARQDVEKIQSTALRIGKIIRGLRTFARNAEMDPFTKSSVKSLIDDTLELCTQRFAHHGVELRIKQIDQGEIECRPAQISQVILNLLNNALDATVNRTGAWVELSATIERGRWLISVTDSGAGIPPHLAPKLMEPFFTTKEIGKGTGLGLSISRGIMQDHHGTLYYDDSHPHTRFVAELPDSVASDTSQTKKAA